MARFFCRFLLLIPALGWLGCTQMTGKKAINVEKPPLEVQTKVDPRVEELTQRQSAAPAQDIFMRSQVDVELAAKWLSPGIMQVAVMNKTQKPMKIGIENFAMFMPPNKALFKPLPESSKTFQAVEALKPGTQASGQLQFQAPAGGGETRLAFEHPGVHPALTLVR